MLTRTQTTGQLAQALAGLDELAAALEATAIERDRRGGHAAEQKALVRDHGLLLLSIPEAEGGLGASWSTTFDVVRRLARADSAIAHLLAFQQLQLSGLFMYATAEQRQRLIGETVRGHLWWGNAANPADPRLRARKDGSTLVLDGVKGFCSGARGSDWLITTAVEESSNQFLIAVLPTVTTGVTIHDDWDPVGQRQTDSTSVSFDNVRIPAEDVLFAPGTPSSPFLSLRGVLAQNILVNLYLGIAEGALAQARHYTLEQARPWSMSGVQRVADDPYVLHRYAEFDLANVSAAALADEAGRVFDRAWERGVALTADERGEAAVASARAKVLAHRASLNAGEGIFDVTGARAAQARLGLDRFWRNARTHTLHDPIDYKLRDIGRFALEGRYPEPSLYS